MKNIIKGVLVIYRPSPKCLEIVKCIIPMLREAGLSVNSMWVDDLVKELKIKTDLVLSVGGDGTLLKISRIFQDISPLILPIPCGRRTVLYEDIDISQIDTVIEKLLRGEFTIQLLDRIRVHYEKSDYLALNEIALISVDRGKVVGFEISINTPSTITKYYIEGDGLIIGPSTGSAAYNLSMRGPLLDYGLEAMFITPINPMELNIAPIVVPPLSKVIIESKGFTEVYIDGEKTDILAHGKKIFIELSHSHLRLVRFKEKKNYVSDVFDKRRVKFEI
ncbi:MAG: NAD(+)/NADH kinase [Staphylothermus sp.]|nr:NAD(+)/NADH kinase [Staphylothermus sp.]